MKYYIASKLENHAEHNRVRDILNALGHELTYDWTHHGPVYRSGLNKVSEIALEETNGVRNADFVVVLWPGGRGTHVEMGIAIGMDKEVVFISDNEAHHTATEETCAFYHYPRVRRFRNMDEAMPLFRAIAPRVRTKKQRA